METPDNCQCYCYAIMSSLCFPCQVKVHLLHLTASPHGELIKNVKCPTPKDRSQSPQSTGNDRSRTPTSPIRENGGKADCENCDYYTNFIHKLTSGLCEENILRMVCSNPCLVGSNLPAGPGGTRKDYTPPSKPSPEEPPSPPTIDNTMSNNEVANQEILPKVSLRSNASASSKAKDNPHTIINNQVSAANHLSKKKSEISPDKKPTTPSNLMTTDKMLKRSFDSIAKNRPSPISSRTTSPEKKRLEIKQTPVTDPKPIKGNILKNDSKQVKKDSKNSTFQKSLPNSTLSKATKNEPKARQMTSKEIGKKLSKSEGKGNTVSAKKNSTDASAKTRRPPLNPPVLTKNELKPTEPANVGANKCNEEVCEFVPRMHHNAGERHQVQHANEKEMQKTAGNEKERSRAMEMGPNNNDAPPGEFFEAALVTEFYQPPQLGSRNVGSKRATKPLHTEYQNESSNRNLGEGILKQFCQKPIRYSTREEQEVNEGDSKTEYNNQHQQAFYAQKVGGKQQTNEERLPPLHYTMLEEYVEYLPLEREDTKIKNKKSATSKPSPGSTKKGLGEDKARRRSRPITSYKKQDVSSRGGKPQPPIFEEVNSNRVIDHQETGANETDNEPVRDSGMNERDASTHLPASFDRQQEERGRNSMYISTGRDGKDKPKLEADLIRETAENNCIRRESEFQRNSIYNGADDYTPGVHPTNGTRDLSPAKIFRESVRQSVHNEEEEEGYACEFPTAARYMPGGTADLSRAKKTGEDIPNRKNIDGVRDACEYTPGAPCGLEYIPNATQGIKKVRQYSKRTDKNRDQVEGMEQIRESISHCEVDVKGPRGRLSDDSKDRPVAVGVIKKIREEIESGYRRNSHENQAQCQPDSPTQKKRIEESPKPLNDAGPSHRDDKLFQPGSPAQKKSRLSSQRHGHSLSVTSVDEATRVYPQFSEYMNPDSERYTSKSAVNVVESRSVHDPVEIPPVKSKSERGSSRWNCEVCPDDKRVYCHTDSDGKCTSMVIGIPQDGCNSNPHIRINFNKQIKQEIACYKMDKCEQKYDYRDTGTQCDYDPLGAVSPEGSRTATAKSSKNRMPAKTSAKTLQASRQMPSAGPDAQTTGHQQMFYNRPLMRRSFH